MNSVLSTDRGWIGFTRDSNEYYYPACGRVSSVPFLIGSLHKRRPPFSNFSCPSPSSKRTADLGIFDGNRDVTPLRRTPSGSSHKSLTRYLFCLVDGRSSWEIDTCFLADPAAPTVAPIEILRSQRSTVGQLDVDAGVVLCKTRHLTYAVDWHR